MRSKFWTRKNNKYKKTTKSRPIFTQSNTADANSKILHMCYFGRSLACPIEWTDQWNKQLWNWISIWVQISNKSIASSGKYLFLKSYYEGPYIKFCHSEILLGNFAGTVFQFSHSWNPICYKGNWLLKFANCMNILK